MVYLGDMVIPHGRMELCHMVADSTEELFEMADAIGVQRRWVQHQGTPREHFDICKAKRELAVEHGAMEATRREFVEAMWRKCGHQPPSLIEVVSR